MKRIFKIIIIVLILIGVVLFIDLRSNNSIIKKISEKRRTTKKECLLDGEKVYMISIEERTECYDCGNSQIYDKNGNEIAHFVGFVGSFLSSKVEDVRNFNEITDCKEIKKFDWE